MKVKLCLFLLVLIGLSQNVYSSGALRHILPFLSSLGSLNMKEGEIAYDDTKKAIIYKDDSGIFPLANNIDKSPVYPVPVIETITRYSVYPLGYFHSYVYPGKIRIGNTIYSNSNYTRCIYNQDTLTKGPDYYDGSTSSITPPTSSNFQPVYLYLVASGSGFKCMFSHNTNGLESPYDSLRWMRVASYAGSINSSSFRTHNGYTRAFGTMTTITSANTFNFDYLILPTMKFIKFQDTVCPSSQTFNIWGKFAIVNLPDETPVLNSQIMEACSSGGTIKSFDYFVNGSQLTISGTISAIPLRFNGWEEIPASSH